MTTISPDEKREALNEVLESATFFRAEQLRNFLRYVCEMELAGREGELCETLIGIEAFGRPADYSPSEDASVRRRAGDLRDKLHEVYARELADSKVRIELPKGKFVPRFVRIARDDEVDAAAPTIPMIATYVPPARIPVEHLGVRLAKAVTSQPAATSVIANHLGWIHPDETEARRLITFWFVAGCVVGALTVSLGLVIVHWLLPQHPQAAAPQPAMAAETIPSVAVEAGASYEAEARGNTMSGITQASPCRWCSGGARVRNIGRSPRNQLILNNIVVAKDGNYEMVVCYVLEGHRSFFVQVNDDAPIEVPLSGNSWLEVLKISITVPLKAGINKVKFYNDRGYAPDLDRIIIR